jgi:hypothetical protein
MKATFTLFTTNFHIVPISCYGGKSFTSHINIFKIYYFKHAAVSTAYFTHCGIFAQRKDCGAKETAVTSERL